MTIFCTWWWQPERGWEADTTHLRDQIDASTAAVVVNNPSNPCGSVYSREHLIAILEVARTKFVPIIADEIYEHMVSSCPAV
jgi:tyrosine aminotransferase